MEAVTKATTPTIDNIKPHKVVIPVFKPRIRKKMPSVIHINLSCIPTLRIIAIPPIRIFAHQKNFRAYNLLKSTRYFPTQIK